MPLDAATILKEIDAVLARYYEIEKRYRKNTASLFFLPAKWSLAAPASVVAEIISLLEETIKRFAPSKDYGASALKGPQSKSVMIAYLAGVLKTLRSQY